MPTALELAGAEKPEHVFFKSLCPLLKGAQTRSNYDAVYGAYLDLQRAITHDGWKLIAYPKAKVLRLYHLADDPLELTDLAARPEHAGVKTRLFDRLIKLATEMGDALDLKRVYGE